MNQESGFETKEVAVRCQIKDNSARTELNLLKSIGLVKKKNFVKEIQIKTNRGPVLSKKKVEGWFLDSTFSYLQVYSSVAKDLIEKIYYKD